MSWLLRRGLRVLMYHKLAPAAADELTVTPAQLEAQLRWLRAEDFHFVTAADVIRAVTDAIALPARPVLVTFDDAYRDFFELARPVLQALAVPAVVFVPTAFVGQTNAWDGGDRPLMSAEHLRTLAGEGFELGLHSHRHEDFATLSIAQIAEEVRENFAAFRALALTPVPALAYPYGRRPPGAARGAMATAVREGGVRIAFRIGNRINPLPLRDSLEINRLSVRGDESFPTFQRKVCWGRLF